MIFVTGDTHSDFRRFNTSNFPEQKEMTKDDFVIICGDFGGIWYNKNDKGFKEDKFWLSWFEDKSYTTLFVDGNHENFDELYSYPIVDFHGGKAHRINSSLYHLMRGEMYELNGKRFFTFGGASSHDISDGILEPDDWRNEARKLERRGKYMYRVRNISWWEQELPSNEEINHANETLEKYNYECDFFISHCCATSTQIILGGFRDRDKLTDYFESIKGVLKYKKHFFGHYHDNMNLPDNEILLYEQIIRIV